MGEIHVVNYKHSPDCRRERGRIVVPEGWEIVMRSYSVLANHWSHLSGTAAAYRVETRDEAVACYREWLWSCLTGERRETGEGRQVRAEINRLYRKWQREGELFLVCCCAPLGCHAGAIREALLEGRRIVQARREDRSFLGMVGTPAATA